jgi:cysteine dioxygenase
LYRDAGLEAMQAGWQPDGCAVPHDHGLATGAVLVLGGSFVETIWRLRIGQLSALGAYSHTAGSVMRVSSGLLHSLHAHGVGHTLHVYAPPVTGMRVYDVAAREVLELSDEHGAWLPRDRHFVRARRSFEEACDGER